jgi:2-oxoglutarate/2-oxoacid ferredoxin oxidoreductase subunit alpha
MALRASPEGHPLCFIQGNEACVAGAIHVGCRFYAGYPITPSTEIAEGMSAELPRVNGSFMQMEDEIASIAAIIGASAAGAMSMTATSGPGFSLMQENIGYAYMAQLPFVLVDVQRAGPSTGLPTLLAQADTMQARWGTHGDYTAVVLAASSVQGCYDTTIRAFQLAERFSTPVIVLLDELVGHMREKMVCHLAGNDKPLVRRFPKVPPEWYIPYADTPALVNHPAPFGAGYRYSITGLTHDASGFPTSVPSEVIQRMDNLRNKILRRVQEIWAWDEHYTTDAKYLIVAYGSAARAARGAVEQLRSRKVKAGLMELRTVWPFPDLPLRNIVSRSKAHVVLVAENCMGQLIHPVREALPHTVRVVGVNRYDGHALDPLGISRALKEEIDA